MFETDKTNENNKEESIKEKGSKESSEKKRIELTPKGLHIAICLAKNKTVSLGKLNIPDEYNVNVDRLLDR